MKKTNLVKKLILTLSSMMVCMVLIGVSVYAAISQTATINNSISVSTTGQAKAEINVYYKEFDGTNAVTTKPDLTTTEWGTAVLTKGENADSENHTLGGFSFDQTTGKNMFAYKITVENKSSVTLNVAIDSTEQTNEQIDIYCGTDVANLTKLADDATKVDFDEASLATETTLTYYIVVCTNTKLADMTAAENKSFNLTIVATANAA